MDSTLTNEQRAALGCGPFYGIRCDSGVGGTFGIGAASRNYQFFGWGFGGGFDALNAEASAILQSFPGFEGTGTVGMNGLTATTPGWTTTNHNLVQPGTIGFEGGPVCTRPVGGKLIVLPGCRGAKAIAFDTGAGVWRVTFDDGYNVGQDGCVFGRTLVFASIVGTHQDGSPVDLTSCGDPTKSYTRTGDYNNIATPTTNGAGTLFHPLAGCKTEAQVYSANPADRECDFRNRNFELEFFNAQSRRIPTFRWRRSSAASWRRSPST